MALGEREHGAAEAARESMGRVARIGAGDVDVEDGTQESASRTAPPTIQAPSPLRISRIAHPSTATRRARPERVLRPVAIS